MARARNQRYAISLAGEQREQLEALLEEADVPPRRRRYAAEGIAALIYRMAPGRVPLLGAELRARLATLAATTSPSRRARWTPAELTAALAADGVRVSPITVQRALDHQLRALLAAHPSSEWPRLVRSQGRRWPMWLPESPANNLH